MMNPLHDQNHSRCNSCFHVVDLKFGRSWGQEVCCYLSVALIANIICEIHGAWIPRQREVGRESQVLQRWRNDFGFGFVRPVFPLNEWKQMIMELESVIFRNSLCEWLPPIRMVASMRFVMTWWCLVHITR